nr:reverse transcriptase domain-containing protein [Tanacetum cinerariifolium]
MALWKSQMEDHTSDWLRVVSIFGLGQTMNGKTYRCVSCYRLGVLLFSVSKPCSACSKVFTGDIYGDHVVSCGGVIDNASNKRKWGSNHDESLSQQNKGHKVPRAHTAWPINKKAYAGSLPLCNRCKSHHSGPCTVKCGDCKKFGHIIQNFRTPATAKNQRTHTFYECRNLRHYKSECPIVKFHKHMDVIHGRVRASKPKTMQDAIEIATKLINKMISTLAECQTENKKSNIQKGTGASQKATCYECGNQGHYRRDCPERKNQNHENQIESTEACGVVHAFRGGETK